MKVSQASYVGNAGVFSVSSLPPRGYALHSNSDGTDSIGAKSLDLSFQVEDFKLLCTSWAKCEPDLNSVSVQHVKK